MAKLIRIIVVTCIVLGTFNLAYAEFPFEQKPTFSGCFENYLDDLIRRASIKGKAEGEHMGYGISMIRYINNQQCVIDIAIYSGQSLVDRRMVECTN